MRWFVLPLAAGALLGIGVLAAVVVTAASAGSATLGDLPSLGYTLTLRADLSMSPPCSMYWVTGGNGAPETIIGDPDHPSCTTPELLQARIDALLAAYPPAPPLPRAPPTVTVATTVHDTTTEAVTTTVTNTETLPVTTTVSTTAPPAETVTVTTTAEPIVRTETLTVPQTLTATVTQTVTVQAPPPTPAWLRALTIRSLALNALYGLGE